MPIRILIIGYGDLSEKQKQILLKHFGEYIIVEHIRILDDINLRRIKPTNMCKESGEGEEKGICVDAVVFLKVLAKPAVELLKRGIRVYDFEVVHSPNGRGDLHDGMGKTIGLREYRLSPKPAMRWVYAE